MGCTWLAWVIGRPDTLAWGADPLEAVDLAGEALSRAGEKATLGRLKRPQGDGWGAESSRTGSCAASSSAFARW